MIYSTQWLIERDNIANFLSLYDLAADLNCLLWQEHTRDQEGYWISKLFLCAASEPVFRLFEERVSQRIQMARWSEIEMPENEVPTVDTFIRMTDLSGNLYLTLHDGLLEAARENERLIGTQ